MGAFQHKSPHLEVEDPQSVCASRVVAAAVWTGKGKWPQKKEEQAATNSSPLPLPSPVPEEGTAFSRSASSQNHALTGARCSRVCMEHSQSCKLMPKKGDTSSTMMGKVGARRRQPRLPAVFQMISAQRSAACKYTHSCMQEGCASCASAPAESLS